MAFRLFTQRNKKPIYFVANHKPNSRVDGLLCHTRSSKFAYALRGGDLIHYVLRKIRISTIFRMHLIFATYGEGNSRHKMMDKITYLVFCVSEKSWLSPNYWLRYYWDANGTCCFVSVNDLWKSWRAIGIRYEHFAWSVLFQLFSASASKLKYCVDLGSVRDVDCRCRIQDK